MALKIEPVMLYYLNLIDKQTRFNEIDIIKLTKDKALNRHIHGQMSLEYDMIRQAAQQSSKSMLVA